LTQGDVGVNIRKAIHIADRLMDLGYAPYVPHLNFFQHLSFPRHYEDWMTLDFAWLDQCNAIIRIPGISPGANREMTRATKELGLEVLDYYNYGGERE
jgi:hypothetical protein